MSLFDFINGAQTLTPYAGAQTPEQPAVTAPAAGAGPSTPVAAASVGASGKKHKGVLGSIVSALGDVVSPQPGSWWWAANNGGIINAKSTQQLYNSALAENQLKQLLTAAQIGNLQAKAKKDADAPDYQIAGNNVVVKGADGQPQFLTPPQNETETERLINRWQKTTDPAQRALLERAIKGYQYTPQVIAEQGAARTATAVAGADARGAQARMTKATPGASVKSTVKLPGGFILNQ